MPSGARQGWLIATGIMLALCLFAVWQSSLLSLTDKLGPGPGFFPFWLALIGSGFSLALLIGVIRAPADPPDSEPILPLGWGLQRIGAIVGTLAVTTLLMELLGFQLAMLGFNVVLLVALGERRWIAIGLFALAGSFGVYYVFTRWLDVLLPTGLLGQ
jgi:putative tricarboxylic transport membrane protein